jgi:Lhr-like helicase
MKKIIILVSLLLLLGIGLSAQQSTQNYQSANNSSAYMYSGTITGAEQLKIYAYIWGQVKKPGLYIVPDDTDLLTILSLAGGPTETAKLSQVKVIRPTATGEKKVFLVDLKKYIQTGDEKIIPILKPGDTIVVSGTVFYGFTKITDFISKVAVILSVYLTISKL